MQPYFDPTRKMTSKKKEDNLKKMKNGRNSAEGGLSRGSRVRWHGREDPHFSKIYLGRLPFFLRSSSIFFLRSSFLLGQNKVAYRKSASCVAWKCLNSLCGWVVGVGWVPLDFVVIQTLYWAVTTKTSYSHIVKFYLLSAPFFLVAKQL